MLPPLGKPCTTLCFYMEIKFYVMLMFESKILD
jgi:hypothetical protein